MDGGVSCDLRVPGVKEKIRCRLEGSCISFVIHPLRCPQTPDDDDMMKSLFSRSRSDQSKGGNQPQDFQLRQV